MLLIGDIHITTKVQKPILSALRNFVAGHPDEQHLIFLGDYVYHFTYDRKALLGLFEFFVELYQQGKQVWVLAGNHDRIHEHFVFAEGKWSFDSVQQSGSGSLHFITEAKFAKIEGRDILFFPFTRLYDQVTIDEQFTALCDSEHQGILQSARANSLLSQQVAQRRSNSNRSDQLTVIHHRYMVDTVFPGQQARFSYKSPGLSSHWFDESDIQLLSGHLHQSFVHKNYCCVGSVWSTSPLEINQLKFVFVWKEGKLYPQPLAINPYLSCELEGEYTKDALTESRGAVCHDSWQHLTTGRRQVAPITGIPPLPINDSTVYFRGPSVSYDNLADIVDAEVLQQVKDYKIRQPRKSLDVALSSLEDSSLQLDERIADWKTLLQRFLQAKYGQEYESYYSLLQELDVL